METAAVCRMATAITSLTLCQAFSEENKKPPQRREDRKGTRRGKGGKDKTIFFLTGALCLSAGRGV
jgi:hypothetical protein